MKRDKKLKGGLKDVQSMEDIEGMTARTGWLPFDRYLDLLIRFEHARGSSPNIFAERGLPVIGPGQIWALNEKAGLPNRLIYIHAVSDAVIFVMGVSDLVGLGSPKDYIFDAEPSPLGFPFMIETWNSLEISVRLLGHCVGTITPEDIQHVRSAGGGPANIAKTRPIRWPGDPRTDFQSAERRRYRSARLLSRSTAESVICDIRVPVPVGATDSESAFDLAPAESRDIVLMAAKTETTGAVPLKLYRPILEYRALRMALVGWGDGSVGIAADFSETDCSAEFVSQNSAPVPVESWTIEPAIRVWRVGAAEVSRTDGVEGVFRVGNGLITVSLSPGEDGGGDPTVSEFARHAGQFEATGASLPDILKTITACKDRILQSLLEEDVKRIIRMDRHHPSWSFVFKMIRSLGTRSLTRWAHEQNG